MGYASTGKIVIVLLLLGLTGILLLGKPEQVNTRKPLTLDTALSDIGPWRASNNIPYDEVIVNSLSLDDYINKNYTHKDKNISLYIGYYFTLKKVGAAHDPLVCFPGQGWKISRRSTGSLKDTHVAKQNINYSTMRVEKNGQHGNLLLYWFQANTTAHASTFKQKLAALYQKFRYGKEDNAFIRLTCPLSDSSETECLQTLQSFATLLQPELQSYVEQ